MKTSEANAAALIRAVNTGDPNELAKILQRLKRAQLEHVACLLARHVDLDSALGHHATLITSPAAACDLATNLAATLFDTTPELILAGDRHRNVTDARQVAMAAARLAGYTTTAIGRHFGRDHSTVIHAATRVGETRRLRAAARTTADRINTRGHIAGEADTTDLFDTEEDDAA